MKKSNLFILPLTFVVLESSSHVLAQAQAQPELDITITVLDEGQSPDGFIQQLVLPSAEFFNDDEITTATAAGSDVEGVGTEISTDAAADITDLTTGATETVTNAINETISIDGTAAVVAEPGLVPPAVVDVLDENLPLVNSLDDVLNETTGGLVNGGLPGVGVLPTVPDLVPGVGLPVLDTGFAPPPVADVLDGDLPLVDSLDGVFIETAEGAVEIVDNLTVDAENLLPGLNDTAGELLNTDSALDDVTAPVTNLLPADLAPNTGGLQDVTNDAVEAAEDIVDETPEAPVADTLDDVTRNLPDLLR